MVCSDSAHETYPWLRACDKTVTTLEYPDVTSAIACCWSRCGMEWCDEEVSSVQASGVEVVVGPPSLPSLVTVPPEVALRSTQPEERASKCQAAGGRHAGATALPAPSLSARSHCAKVFQAQIPKQICTKPIPVSHLTFL